jgi:hypothetical protein
MMRIVFFAGASAVALGCCALLACNSIFGIDSATLEPAVGTGNSEAGPPTNYEVTCDNYCNLVTTACGSTDMYGTNLEYLLGLAAGSDAGVCAAICPFFEPGGPADPNAGAPSTDTLSCRVWHANAALEAAFRPNQQEETHYHCPHAGPLGGTFCNPMGTDPCTPFCTLDMQICGTMAYPGGMDDCLSACRGSDAGADGGTSGFVYLEQADVYAVSDLAYSTGNTLNCRMYHLENAVLISAAVHCPHTSESGGGVCVGPTGGP